MAKYSAKDVAFYLVDGFSLLGLTTTLGDVKEAILGAITALGDTWPSHADTGMRRAEFTTDGFYDDATGAVNQALAEQEGVSRIVCYGLEGNTVGAAFAGLSGALAGKYVRTAQLAEFHRARGEWTVSGQVDDGIILHELSAETTDGDTEGADSVDNGGSSAGGGVAYLQVSAITLDTATNLVVKVRHSADDITYADLVTFTAVTARGAQRSTTAVTVDQHLAASWAWTGGAGAGSTATFLVGFKRAA